MPQNYGALEKVLRAGEGRRLKTLRDQAAYITSLEPELEALSDDELRGKTAEFRRAVRERRVARGHALRGLRSRPRGPQARVGAAHLRRPADGRDRPPRGRHRRDEDRRGQDLRRQPAAVPERDVGRERPPGHGQRLPGQARRRVEPRRLRAAGRDRGLHREHDAVRDAQGRLRVRHHLRHELRVRVRLPARQHGRLDGRRRPARAHLRDRGRGRLDPRRRGADAADHLRRAGDGGQDVLRLRAHRQGPRGRPVQAAVEDRQARGARRRLHVRREVQDGLAAPARHPRGRARAADRQPLRPAQRPARQPPEPGAEGAGALPPRRRLRRPGRRGEDRRRVHRPHHGRPPLERGPAPGGRGEGGRADPGGARHAGDDHAAELLPPLRQARRHDRHGQDGGEGVHRDLRPARRRDPDQRRDRACRTRTT